MKIILTAIAILIFGFFAVCAVFEKIRKRSSQTHRERFLRWQRDMDEQAARRASQPQESNR